MSYVKGSKYLTRSGAIVTCMGDKRTAMTTLGLIAGAAVNALAGPFPIVFKRENGSLFGVTDTGLFNVTGRKVGTSKHDIVSAYRAPINAVNSGWLNTYSNDSASDYKNRKLWASESEARSHAKVHTRGVTFTGAVYVTDRKASA